MTKLIVDFARHGMTRANEQGVFCGVVDYPLSPLGVQEITDMVALNTYDNVDRVYRSPLTRCLQTANLIFPHHGDDTMIVVQDLIEINFGDYEEVSAREVRRQLKAKNMTMTDRGFVFPNGEGFEHCRVRSCRAIEYVIRHAMDSGYNHIGVVTHSMVLSAFIRSYLIDQMTKEEVFMPNGMGFRVEATLDNDKLHYRVTDFLPIGATRPSTANSPYVSDD